jgi:hypothetical protein
MRGKAALSDLDGLELAVELPVDNLLALDEALTNLAERDAQAAQPALRLGAEQPVPLNAPQIAEWCCVSR